jgi:hypothetical protein
VFNEINEVTKFYRTHMIEKTLRTMAKTYPNSYIVGTFVSGRPIYNTEDMTGCIQVDNRDVYLG